MKIHQLPDGARFEYKGEEYVKTGPMFGTGPKGPQLIPRSAIVKPLGAASAVESIKERITRALVVDAFNAFYAECRLLVPDEEQHRLDSLRDRFMRSLDESPMTTGRATKQRD